MSEEQELFSRITGNNAKAEPSFLALPGESLIDTQDSLNIKKQKLDIQLKQEFSTFIKSLVEVWVAFIACMLFFSSINFVHISDTVLVALIAGTTVNIIGLVVIVAKHLFPSGDKTKCRNYEE